MMGRRKPTGRRKIFVAALAGLLALALALSFVIPLKPWFPNLEAQLSEALGEQVRFETLRIGLLPRPYLEAQTVSIGADRALQAERARLYPDLLSLSESTIFVKLTELDDVAVSRSIVQRAFVERKARLVGMQAIRLGHVHATRVKLDAPGGKLGEFEADADLNRENEVTNVAFNSKDGRIRLVAVPSAGRLLLNISAQDWKPPIGPEVRFERLYAQGVLREGKLALSEFTAGIYGGAVRGGLELTWGSNWTLSGRAQVSRLNLSPLLQLLQPRLKLSGALDSELRFASEAEDAAHLADALKVDGKFRLANGVLRDFDFPGVIQGAGRDGVRGGQTRFEQMSGNLQLGSGYRFSELRLSSGTNASGSELIAAGNISVGADGQLDGAMSVQLKGTAGTLGSTVRTSGTLDDPVLLPVGK